MLEQRLEGQVGQEMEPHGPDIVCRGDRHREQSVRWRLAIPAGDRHPIGAVPVLDQRRGGGRDVRAGADRPVVA